MHKRSLEQFDFDSILLPYNYVMHQNEHYREDFDAVVRLCHERQVAVQTIKAIARGPWATTEKARNTWYQPLEEQADVDRAVHWVIGRPGFFSTPPEISNYYRRSWRLPAALTHAQVTTWRACWRSSV